MCFKFTVLAFACLSSLSVQGMYYKRHVPEDSVYVDPASAVHEGSKYFQDIYVAMEKPTQIEFGHVSETPKAWEQRFEKIDLDNLQRQGKIRWGDKDGGYGEHYYDFNHDTHSPQQVQQQPEPQYYPQESRQVPQLLRVSSPLKRLKREGLLNDVEFINDKAKALILNGKAQKHGGNYQSAYDYDRGKREENKNNEDEEEEEEEDEYSY